MYKFLRILTLVILLVLAGCNSDPVEVASPTPPDNSDESSDQDSTVDVTATPTDIPISPTPDTPFSGDGPWEVSIPVTESVELNGTLYGQGNQIIILASMYPGEQAGWEYFAQAVAEAGYRALTFDFQGYGDSGGTRDSGQAPDDLLAVLQFARDHEAEDMVIIGAGLGGVAAIKAVNDNADQVRGVAIISSPQQYEDLSITEGQLTALNVPSLWIATRNDMNQHVEEMFTLAGSEDKELWIYEGSSLPGTYIFEGADSEDLKERLLKFASRLFEN